MFPIYARKLHFPLSVIKMYPKAKYHLDKLQEKSSVESTPQATEFSSPVETWCIVLRGHSMKWAYAICDAWKY